MNPKTAFLQQVRQIGKDAEALKHQLEENGGEEKPLGYLTKLIKAAKSLGTYAKAELSNDGFSQSDDEADETVRHVRHEVRNKLNHVSGPCQLLQRRLAKTDWKKEAAELRDSIDNCLATIDGYGTANAEAVRVLETEVVEIVTKEKARILVAEDDEENRNFLDEVLSSEGHQVTLSVNGVDALAQAEKGDFDLILLELVLPKLSGFEVLERLQKNGWQTPVVVVTGRRGVQDAVRCIQHGANDFLSKPVQVEMLRARVNSCVEKMRLREREFSQFFPPKLARVFARRPRLLNDMPSKHAEVSILFVDIRGFSTISERLGPEKTTRWLRAVMNEMSDCVIENEGVLVDFAGDEIMAMWGAPEEIPDHAERACTTAVSILERLPVISEAWKDEIGTTTEVGIGVNSGRAMVGHIGTARKTKYGPLGNTVNLASRVQGATKHLHTFFLITGATRNRLGAKWKGGDMRQLCRVRVKNIAKPVELHEMKPKSKSRTQAALRRRYEKALAHFEEGELQQASAILGQLLVDQPEDGPSLMLMKRVVDSMLDEEEEFDPVWELPSK